MNNFLKSFNNTGKVLPSIILLIAVNIVVTEGVTALTSDLLKVVRKFPFVNSILNLILEHEVAGAVKLLSGPGGNKEGDEENKKSVVLPIPEVGVSPNEVLEIIKHIHDNESAAEDGKAFAYTYTTSTDMKEFSRALGESYSKFAETSGLDSKEHDAMLGQVWSNFMHTNALNPMMYPSLRKFETEIVSMATWMCHGDTTTAGSLTSGGTESILMAIKCYRDRARKLNPNITRPNMIVPQTIHPAFEKAAHYFDVEIIHIKVNSEYRVDIAEVEKACNSNTILIVGSAPQYCHAVVDPIEELAEIALRKGLPLHVDACFGGFMLPWLEKLGKKIPLWDFRVRGVTSISADVHKYGYSSKGASVILYKNDDIRSYQYFAYSAWPGGLFGSPSMSGSRPGGMIAAAWAAMTCMGQDGYMKIAKGVLDTTEKIIAAVGEIDGIKIATNPDMTALAIISEDVKVNILAVADCMESIGGWKMERQQLPDSLHMSILPQHARVVDKLIKDLVTSVKMVRDNQNLAKQGSTGVYGMVAAIPDKGIINDFVVKFFSTLYTHNGEDIVSNHRKLNN